MLDVYREIDFQIGRLLAALDLSETTFILFSMHGMTAGRAQDHFLPDVMERINQLYLKRLVRTRPPPSNGGLARLLRQTVPASVQLKIRQMVGPTVQIGLWIANGAAVRTGRKRRPSRYREEGC